MPNMFDINPEPQYVLMKGEPGTRKSTCALSYPGPQYWFSYDQKMEALIRPMRNWGIDPKMVEYDDYTDWNKAKSKLEILQSNCKYKTLVIDSITSLGDAINRQTLKIKYGTKSNTGADKGKLIGGIAVNSIEDFNAEASALQELLALTKDIHKFHKINVILIAHIIQTEQKSPNGQTHMSRLIVTGGKKVAAKIPSLCPEIYHFNIESGHVVGQGGAYTLLTAHTGDDFARTSLPLDGKIQFGDDSLYKNWIEPAIAKLKQPVSV